MTDFLETFQIKRRDILLNSLALSTSSAIASSIKWPIKPIKIIVPWPSGGQVDGIARVVAQSLSSSFKTPIIVENKPGAASNIGSAFVAKSSADGYTLLMATSANPANISLYKNLGYDLLRDLTPISLISESPTTLAVGPKFPARSLQEFIDLARKNSDSISFGSPGVGSPGHLAAERLMMMTGIKLRHIPYQGAPQAVQDLIGGNLQSAFVNVTATQSFANTNRLSLLGVTTSKRWPLLPDTPTFSENGVPGYEWSSWIGLMAPSGVNKEIIDTIYQSLSSAINRDVQIALRQLGSEPLISKPMDLEFRLKSEIQRYAAVIKAAGITIE